MAFGSVKKFSSLWIIECCSIYLSRVNRTKFARKKPSFYRVLGLFSRSESFFFHLAGRRRAYWGSRRKKKAKFPSSKRKIKNSSRSPAPSSEQARHLLGPRREAEEKKKKEEEEEKRKRRRWKRNEEKKRGKGTHLRGRSSWRFSLNLALDAAGRSRHGRPYSRSVSGAD